MTCDLSSPAVHACPVCRRQYAPRLDRHHVAKRINWHRTTVHVRSQQHHELQVSEGISAPPKPVMQNQPLIAKGLGLVLVAGLAGFVLVKQLTSNKRDRHAADSADKPQVSQGSHQDSKDFKAAVARTRQAVCVQKAIGFMDASSPAKAIVELKHALEENGVARGPLLNNKYDKDDRLRLYRLHLQNTEVPPNFAVLLQLREMLAISEVDAEQSETEVFESGSAFSI